jgi:acyl dehydratase
MTDRWFDDFEVGQSFSSTGITVSESQMLDFAMVYDPQPFHIDAEAAKASIYGGLIASGFQTIALGFRCVLQMQLFAKSSMGSPGIDEVRWLLPVRPGDTLHTVLEVLEKRPSRSKPDRGIVVTMAHIRNQKNEEVASFKGMHLLARRPA